MKKISEQDFSLRIKERFPKESFIIIKYSSLGESAIIQCKNCKNNIEISKANNFLAKNKRYGCKECYGLQKERQKFLNLLQEKYKILSTSIKNSHTYYLIECKNCGHQRKTTLNNLKKNFECGCQTGCKRMRSAEEFLAQANKNCREGKYILESEYINQSEKVLLRHSCGFIWKVRPSDVINGKSFCPVCGKKESKGSSIITKLLTELNIYFEKEYPLKNSLQKFDFYLPNLNIAIEYNGIQHYKEIKHFSTTLQEQQKRDEKKRKYCKENNIQLYEISYLLSESEIIDMIKKIINSTTISNESKDKAILKQ